MITILMVAAFVVASCIAAAGLIASTQNNADAVRAAGGFEIGQDVEI